MSNLTLQQLIDNRLLTRLGMLQKVEAFNHRSTHINDTTVKFPYNNWLTTITPIFYRNGTLFNPTSYSSVDGTATINDLIESDDITASYTFQYFTNTDLQNYLQLAVSRANSAPPITSFTIEDVLKGTGNAYPEDWEWFLTGYAYKLSLQTLLVDLMNWRSKLIWSDPIALSGIVQTVLGQVEAEINGILLTLKGRRYSIPRMVSAGRWVVPAQVTDNNFKMYTTIRS